MKTNQSILLVDAGTGNLHSVYNALETLGARVTLTSDPADIRRGGRIVLPGVGAFGKFMQGLRQKGMEPPLLEAITRGDMLLGICVGMQALFTLSEEMGHHAGLAVLPGSVVRFPNQTGLKVPHTGWNQLWPQQPSPLFSQVSPGDYAYFNHSYYAAAAPDDTAATTDYGLTFACVVQRGSLFGVQFHPEKSQRVGLQILKNFIEL